MNYSLVYILGMGRSGTTMLQNMFHAHPIVCAPAESFFPIHLYHKYESVVNWDDETLERFIDDLYTERSFRLIWKLPRKQVRDSLARVEDIDAFAKACNAVFLAYDKKYLDDIHCIVDKNPVYSLFIKRIMKIRPRAKVIHMTRDPRGTINSQVHTFNRKYVAALGHMWNYYNGQIRNLKREGVEYRHVTYEELIARPERTLRELCDFIGVSYDPDMLSYRDRIKKRQAQQAHEVKWKHDNLTKSIDDRIAKKWKDQLTSRQVSDIEEICAREATHYGYQFTSAAKKRWLRDIRAVAFSRLMFSGVRLFFSLPFPIRKFILAIRSKIGDHKYQN